MKIAFGVLLSDNTNNTFEKDTGDVETFTMDGLDYYIFTNNRKNVAVWHSDNLEYSLSTTLPISELEIIFKIYKVECHWLQWIRNSPTWQGVAATGFAPCLSISMHSAIKRNHREEDHQMKKRIVLLAAAVLLAAVPAARTAAIPAGRRYCRNVGGAMHRVTVPPVFQRAHRLPVCHGAMRPPTSCWSSPQPLKSVRQS